MQQVWTMTQEQKYLLCFSGERLYYSIRRDENEAVR